MHEQFAHTDGATLVAVEVLAPKMVAEVGVNDSDALLGDMVINCDERTEIEIGLTIVRLIEIYMYYFHAAKLLIICDIGNF